MPTHRFAAAALAAFAAATAVPLGLAQLDFAGIVTFVGIDHGDTPSGVLVFAGVSGIATLVLSVVALAGAALALVEPRRGRKTVVAVALGGLVSATIFWIPQAVMLAAAAFILRDGEPAQRPAAA
jgi:hypothetical protein